MMYFRQIKTALEQLLIDKAAGRYRVQGYQIQTRSPEEVEGNNRLVVITYDQGDFPGQGYRSGGSVDHQASYRVALYVSSGSIADIQEITNAENTNGQRQTSLSVTIPGHKIIDDSIDELFEIVFQVILDREDTDLGLGSEAFDKLIISQYQKDDPFEMGGKACISASFQIQAKLNEEITGADPIAGESINTLTDINGAGNVAGTDNNPNE